MSAPVTNPADLERRLARLTALYQVSQVLHSTLDPREAMQRVIREAVRLMRATSGSIVLLNPLTQLLEIHAAYGLPPGATRLCLKPGEGITGWVARTGRPARVGNVATDPRYIMLRPEVRSELAVPLEVRGVVRGVLNVDADQPDAFSAEDEALLTELAVPVAAVIHNTWQYEQLRLKARWFETLVTVGQTVNSPVNLTDALQTITREAGRLMDARLVSLLLLEASGEWLELEAAFGAGPAYLQKPRLSVSDSLLGSVVRRRKPLQVENVQTSPAYQHPEIARQEGLVSLLSVPLLYHGKALGVLNVYTATPHNFSNEEIQVLSAFADFSALAIEKARLYERLVQTEEQLRRQEQLSTLGLLAAELAHEIRNPLTVMQMLFHSLDLRFPDTDPRARDLAVFAATMARLNRLVDRVLDLARHNEPRFVPVQLNRLLTDLALLIQPKCRQQGIEYLTRLDPALPQITADPAQLEQALLNLLLNAIEAMPEGGRLTLTTRAVRLPARAPSPTHLAIGVRDTGPGMAPAQRARAFRTLLDTTKPHGTGLGLAITARVIEAHRGKILLASLPGQGTTVTLLLPV